MKTSQKNSHKVNHHTLDQIEPCAIFLPRRWVEDLQMVNYLERKLSFALHTKNAFVCDGGLKSPYLY
jgi:hypothetical protein